MIGERAGEEGRQNHPRLLEQQHAGRRHHRPDHDLPSRRGEWGDWDAAALEIDRSQGPADGRAEDVGEAQGRSPAADVGPERQGQNGKAGRPDGQGKPAQPIDGLSKQHPGEQDRPERHRVGQDGRSRGWHDELGKHGTNVEAGDG